LYFAEKGIFLLCK